MAKKKQASKSKFQTIKAYTRIVCGKKQKVKAHNKKKRTKTKQRRLL